MSGESTPRIPFYWAVSLAVAIVMPLSFYLDKFNFTLWVSFIGWAEYYLYGGTPKAFKIVFPCWTYGTVMSVFWMLLTVAVSQVMPVMWASIIANFIAVTLLVWGFKFYNFGEGSVAVFGGFTCLLALYFTNTMPKIGPLDNPYYVVILAGAWCLLMGYFGHILGWFTVVLTFPKKSISKSSAVSQ